MKLPINIEATTKQILVKRRENNTAIIDLNILIS